VTRDFDVVAMFEAMDARRVERGLSWQGLADAIWEQSSVLNARRRDHPISAATLKGIAKRGDCTCQHALFVLSWLERSPESFVPGTKLERTALPAAGSNQRLRWDLEALFAALDAQRRERERTWAELAAEMHCTSHQLAGLKTVRFAIGMKLAMRIVQWLGRPASDFIDVASW
jgi:hypothetical protein